MMATSEKYRVMIVDDDPDVREILKDCISERYEVVDAKDGEEALAKLKDAEPDFIILDMEMPGMDGFQTCEAIRKTPGFQQVQILFLSAYSSRENISHSYESGANLFISKPVAPDRLMKNISLSLEETGQPPRRKRMTLKQVQLIKGENSPGANRLKQSRHEARSHAFHRPALATRPIGRAPGEGPPEAKPQGVTPDKARVLIVEDDRDLAELTALRLSDAFEVVIAKDGLDGISKLVEFEPDMVLLDVMMPRMNGYQLCQSIRQNRAFHLTPIIIVTAKKSERDKEYAEKMGANAFVTKPYDMDQFFDLCVSYSKKPDFRIRPKKKPVPIASAGEKAGNRHGAFEKGGRYD